MKSFLARVEIETHDSDPSPPQSLVCVVQAESLETVATPLRAFLLQLRASHAQLSRAKAVYADHVVEIPVNAALLWSEWTEDDRSEPMTMTSYTGGINLGFPQHREPEPGDQAQPFIVFDETSGSAGAR